MNNNSPSSAASLSGALSLSETVREMVAALETALPGARVQVRDDSALHAGHAGRQSHGGGHFKATIDWHGFAGMPRLARQRLVHAAVAGLWQKGRIHALALALHDTMDGAQEPAP